MALHTEILSDLRQLPALHAAWETMAAEDPTSLLGLDATAGPLWFATLAQVFSQARTARIVVVRDGLAVVGLLPVYAEPGSLAGSRLVAVNELYGGRSGFLLARPEPELLAALLRGTRLAYGNWSSLRMTLVEGSISAQVLAQLTASSAFRAVKETGEESPYFPLLDEADAFNAGMSKGLRQTIRTAINKLRPLGELVFSEIRDAEQADQAIEGILTVERQSWKHEAGTAISCVPEQEAFYRALLPSALKAGLAYGQILVLDGAPIAFNFGLIREGVYSCLKHSNTQEHQPYSPAQVLNANLVNSLRQRGVIFYDYMGKAEPHKLRWSSETARYKREPTWIYDDSVGGQVSHAAHRLKKWVRERRRQRSPAAAPAGD